MTLKDRLLSKVSKDDETGCWNWQAFKNPAGYGDISVDGKVRRAHRVSYAAFIGCIPAGLNVLHRCDNPSCINPDHLFLGTQAENISDKVSKGRQPRGAANCQAKLSEADVLAIRSSKETQRPCAKRFGISQRHVSAIRSGQRWAHINEDGAGK